jgi:hypothetical protein
VIGNPNTPKRRNTLITTHGLITQHSGKEAVILIFSHINPLPIPLHWKPLYYILLSPPNQGLGLPSGLFPACFPTKTTYALLFLPHMRHMPCPPHSPWFAHPNSIWWGVYTSTQGTPPYRRHLQCRTGRSARSNRVGSYAGRANQARQIPTEEPDEMCLTATGQKGLSKAATSTLIGLGAHHSHTRKKIDSETKGV